MPNSEYLHDPFEHPDYQFFMKLLASGELEFPPRISRVIDQTLLSDLRPGRERDDDIQVTDEEVSS